MAALLSNGNREVCKCHLADAWALYRPKPHGSWTHHPCHYGRKFLSVNPWGNHKSVPQMCGQAGAQKNTPARAASTALLLRRGELKSMQVLPFGSHPSRFDRTSTLPTLYDGYVWRPRQRSSTLLRVNLKRTTEVHPRHGLRPERSKHASPTCPLIMQRGRDPYPNSLVLRTHEQETEVHRAVSEKRNHARAPIRLPTSCLSTWRHNNTSPSSLYLPRIGATNIFVFLQHLSQ